MMPEPDREHEDVDQDQYDQEDDPETAYKSTRGRT